MFENISLNNLLQAAPFWEVQLLLAVLHTVFWYLVSTYVIQPGIKVAVNALPTVTREHYLSLSQASAPKKLRFYLATQKDLPMEVIASENTGGFMHFAAIFLCLPSLLGLGFSPSVAAALSCHSALCELGFEIQETVVRFREFASDDHVRQAKNPGDALGIMVAHHLVTQWVVLPLNLYYHDNAYYHEAIFLLQMAAAVSFFSLHFGMTCDMKKQGHLLWMKINMTVTTLALVWGRLLRFLYVWFMLYWTFFQDGCYKLALYLFLPIVLLAYINYGIVWTTYKKFNKFVFRNGVPEPKKKPKPGYLGSRCSTPGVPGAKVKYREEDIAEAEASYKEFLKEKAAAERAAAEGTQQRPTEESKDKEQ